MRIAFVLGRFPVLSETFILSQITGLIDRGHDVEIFASPPRTPGKSHHDVRDYALLDKTHYWPTLATSSDKGRVASAVYAGRKAVKFGRSGLKDTRWAASVTARMAHLGADLNAQSPQLWASAVSLGGARKFDIIISHFGHVARETQMLRDLGVLEGKLVTFFHAWDVTVYLRENGSDIYQHLFEHGDLLLPISEHWRNRLIELGSPPERTMVHHMGIDCAKFDFAPRAANNDVVRLISVARFVEKKGLYYAIRALARVVEKFPNLEYHLVGDGPLRPKIEALVAELGLQDNIRFLGWRTHTEVAEFLDQMHLLWLPSVTALSGDTEGIPMVLMEAMARGLPVLSTYHSGIPELVQDGVSGALVSERDIAGMAEKLTKLLENPDKWAAMGHAGRARVETEFNIELLNNCLETRLKALL